MNSSGTVLEAYDYDPWGLAMPTRSYGSGTKEHFTGKEHEGNNSESGMDYFGARYYMGAMGRFASVDPKADVYPGWSSYNYALDNPLLLVDPNGRAPMECCNGLKLGISGNFYGGFTNVTFEVGVIAGTDGQVQLVGNFGVGGSSTSTGASGHFRSAVGGNLTLDVTSASPLDGMETTAYVQGAASTVQGLAGQVTVSLPMESVGKIGDIRLSDPSSINQVVNDASVEVGIGIGAGGGRVSGVQNESVLLQIGNADPKGTNMNLGDQSGIAPADATNVMRFVPEDERKRLENQE